MPQRRVVLKVSGEQLGSPREDDLIIQKADGICSVIDALREADFAVACVVGGGNIVRGEALTKNGFRNRTKADHMGMAGTVINAIFLAEVLNQRGERIARAMSNLPMEAIIESFSYDRAMSEMERGTVVVIGGGTGKPGVTTDTGVVFAASELDCREVVKTTKVDGIYDRDPELFPDAVRIPKLNYGQVLRDHNIQVMDGTAMAFAEEKGLTIAVCLPNARDVLGVLNGDTERGSLVTPA